MERKRLTSASSSARGGALLPAGSSCSLVCETSTLESTTSKRLPRGTLVDWDVESVLRDERAVLFMPWTWCTSRELSLPSIRPLIIVKNE